jgi:hypothetical protein
VAAETTLTAQDYQAALLVELNQAPDSELAEHMPVFWEICEITGLGYIGLQYLYTMRRAIMFLLQRLREEHDVSDTGVSEQFSQLFQQLKALLEEVDKDIQSFTELVAAGKPPLVGIIEAQVIFGPDPSIPWADQNSRLWRGDPVMRRRF